MLRPFNGPFRSAPGGLGTGWGRWHSITRSYTSCSWKRCTRDCCFLNVYFRVAHWFISQMPELAGASLGRSAVEKLGLGPDSHIWAQGASYPVPRKPSFCHLNPEHQRCPSHQQQAHRTLLGNTRVSEIEGSKGMVREDELGGEWRHQRCDNTEEGPWELQSECDA